MAGFVTIVIKAFMKLSNEETIFITTERENEFELPIITICPAISNLSFNAFKNNKTFEDLYEAIETTKSYYSASVIEAGLDQTNLTNTTELQGDNYSPRHSKFKILAKLKIILIFLFSLTIYLISRRQIML